MLSSVIKAQQRVVGETHPDTLLSLSNLSPLYHQQRRGRLEQRDGTSVRRPEVAWAGVGRFEATGRSSGLAAHAGFMDALYEARFAVLVGPLEGTRDALLVLRASSRSQIIERLASDPWTTNGLLVTTQVSPWQLRLGTVD